MNSRKTNATRRLPLQPFEKYKPPKGKWVKFHGVKIDPRIDSEKLRQSLLRFHRSCLRDISKGVVIAADEKKGRILQTIRRPPGKDNRIKRMELRRECAPNSVDICSYEHWLIGSTTSVLGDAFMPSMVEAVEPGIVSRFRTATGPLSTRQIEFLVPEGDLFRRYPIINLSRFANTLELFAYFDAPLDKSGRLADYPTITRLMVLAEFRGEQKTINFRAPNILDNIAVRRSAVYPIEKTAYYYDLDDCLKIIKLY